MRPRVRHQGSNGGRRPFLLLPLAGLIVSGLAAAQRQLGAEAAQLQILAVTVDPRRDTPAAIRAFLAARGATGRMDYLLGSGAQLRQTWKATDRWTCTGTVTAKVSVAA